MKNNFKALTLHFVIVVLSLTFLIIFAVLGPTIGEYTTHIDIVAEKMQFTVSGNYDWRYNDKKFIII
ncbi:hypothetical protein [Proteiniborus sp.]|uniref:hypothetical protein n=1 Tax=Proteiniborus sp. TaxID=2079015 RepID=UPI0033334B59